MLRTVAICLVVLFPSLCAAADRPNFVWLISEDNSKHFLQLFDPAGVPTPGIAMLAEQGLIFDYAFSNAPVCSVARTTLITGCYAPRIGGQYHRRSVLAPLPEGLKLFPAYLRDAGYYTTNNSKTDYNVEGVQAAWDESSRKASWRNRADGQPFFHKQSFGASHESSLHFPTEDIRNAPTETDPATVLLSPRHPDTPTFRYTYARYHDRIRLIDRQVTEVVDQLAADGLLEDTFVFYFGDHGGVLPGSKGYVWETGLHVPLVVRIPDKWQHLVAQKRGSRVDGFVSFIDFGPTLLHLAGLKVPEQMDGRPFLGPGVSEPELAARNETFGYADRFDEKIDFVRTVRQGRFKYVRSFQPFNVDGLQNNYRYIQAAYAEWRALYDAGKLNEVQRQFFEPRPAEALYDVVADPYETKNLATEQQHLAETHRLRGRLNELMRGMPDLSLYPESVLVAQAMENPVRFGQQHKQDIGRLMDIAELIHQPFAVSRPRLAQELKSADPMHRYWALITCSAYGQPAREFEAQILALAQDDENLLVRTRAAEFLGLHSTHDPAPVLLDVLRSSRDAVQANEILNTIVLLRDTGRRLPIVVTPADVHESIRSADNVKRRLDYLTSSLGRGDRWVRPARKNRRKPAASPQRKRGAASRRAADKR